MNITFDAALISYKYFFNLKKLCYKYSTAEVADMLLVAKNLLFEKLNFDNFTGDLIVFIPSKASISNRIWMKLASQNNSNSSYATSSMEDEVQATFSIENIHSSRYSVRKVLRGYAPTSNE